MKTFKLIDYKGKHFIIQDHDIIWKFDNPYIIKEIPMNIASDKDFAKEHKGICDKYGIPPYIGNDEDLKKLYDPS